MSNAVVRRQKKFQRFFAALCSEWIENRDMKKCKKAEDLVGLTGSLVIGIIGALGALQIWGLFVIAIVVAACTILAFMGLQSVANIIDEEEANETATLKREITKLTELNVENEQRLQGLNKDKEYLECLWAETNLLARAIRDANTSKTAKTLYTKIANSIAEMIATELNIQRDNFSVHVYAYDGNSHGVRRVAVESFVKSKQAADENLLRSINEPEVSKRYYAKALLSKKTIFILPTHDAIKENLFFPVDDDGIIDQYTQYVAMVYDVGSRVKLYVEVVSYNGLRFGEDEKSLKTFVKRTIAPFSTLLSMVDWNTIRRDCSAK